MRLPPSKAERSSFAPVFPLLSDTVISPLFPGIPSIVGDLERRIAAQERDQRGQIIRIEYAGEAYCGRGRLQGGRSRSCTRHRVLMLR